MICYLDTTFCSSPDCRNRCGRKLTPAVKAGAAVWWGKPGAPIATSHFCGRLTFEEKKTLAPGDRVEVMVGEAAGYGGTRVSGDVITPPAETAPGEWLVTLGGFEGGVPLDRIVDVTKREDK